MSIKWTKEEEEFIQDLIDNDIEYTYEDMATLLEEANLGLAYRTSEAIRKFFARKKDQNNNIINGLVDSLQDLVDTIEEENKVSKPKVLIFDIETLPMVTYSWGLWKQNIQPYQIIKDWCILSWTAKWLFDSTIDGDILTSEEAINRDDYRITKSLWDYFNEAEIIVAHNCDAFDVKKSNSRFFLQGLNPPSPYVTIDTLKQSRSCFGFSSHKLDYISELISHKNKKSTSFALWVACDKGEPWALKKMYEYNEYDTELLEEAFIQMLPWMKSVPNFGLYNDSNVGCCCRCGSQDLEPNGFYTTSTNKYQSYRCNDCGGFSRNRHSSINKEQRKNLLVSTAK